MINRSIFFNHVRGSLFNGSLKQSQVDGMDYMLTVFEQDYNWPDMRWLAYAFATAYHETAYTMLPITEYGSQSYLNSKPYAPYWGRGYVQLTWEDNYRKMGQKIGIDLLGNNKDRALEPAIAAEVMYSGMRDGDFTSKRLSHYFSSTVNDPVNARRIINGTDRAQTIAGYHEKFLQALNASIVSEPEIPPAPPVEPEVPATEKYVTRTEFNELLANLNSAINNSILK